MENKKPYLVDAIIGNSKFLASMGRNGRMYRLWWPNIDFPQHVDAIRTGIRVDNTELQHNVTWFDSEDEGWNHQAAYVPQTNIMRILAESTNQPLKVDSYHYAVPGQSIIVRDYSFTNVTDQPLSFEFVMHSSFKVSENSLYNTTTFNLAEDALLHFRRRYFFALSSANVCTKFQAGHAWDAAQQVALNGNVIDMQPDGAVAWRIKELAPGATASIPVYITAGEDEDSCLEEMRLAKSKPSEQWLDDTSSYWKDYLNQAAPCPIDREDITELYERSILMFKLMSDEQTGSIIAAPEFDENFSSCGGYSFCWGRDAAFITTALDKAGLGQLSDHFYDWALTAQSPDGSWQQRHYHDGSLAPSWGLQIDEGASIIWGMWQHFMENKDNCFAERIWPSVERGAHFLYSFLDSESGLPKPSIDLWEEREASHTYSSAAVYGGLTAAASFAELANRQDLAEQWLTAANQIADKIVSDHWNEEKNSFYRGLNLTVDKSRFEQETGAGHNGSIAPFVKGYEKYILQHDTIVDVSLLGVSVPFGVVSPDHDYMQRTADTIEQLLTVPNVGGIKRYENDHYIGGNPWILTTLWLAHYRLQTGDLEKAKQHIQWAIDHRTETGLLPEQVDKNTGATAWVVPLTWSHAMFVLAIFMLAEAEARLASTTNTAMV